MLAFFTNYRFDGLFESPQKGGIFIIFFLPACAVWIVVQNTVVIMIAKALGIEPIIGIMVGSVSTLVVLVLPCLSAHITNNCLVSPGTASAAVGAATSGMVVGTIPRCSCSRTHY